jgi:hypothetical protein
MAEIVRDFYDELAGNCHLMFEDWEASIAHQAAALGPILEHECGPANSVRILDCACGIGTQALGLAMRGFRDMGFRDRRHSTIPFAEERGQLLRAVRSRA